MRKIPMEGRGHGILRNEPLEKGGENEDSHGMGDGQKRRRREFSKQLLPHFHPAS